MAYSRLGFGLLCSVVVVSACASVSPILDSDSNSRVSLDLYYESLCPYSANFVVNYLAEIFENGLISAVDLKLVPWGNAKLRANDTVVCQHGPYECLLNTVEACAIDIWPDLNKHFPFIYCVEDLVYNGEYREWESCFDKLGLDPKPVTDCYTSARGKELELQYGATTDALQPPHKYVPWVVVDGQPLYEDYENFISYICKAYKGDAIQAACSDLSFTPIITARARHSRSVSYKNEAEVSSLWARSRSVIASWLRQMNFAALE